LGFAAGGGGRAAAGGLLSITTISFAFFLSAPLAFAAEGAFGFALV